MDLDLLPGEAPWREEVRGWLDARGVASRLDALLAGPPGYDPEVWQGMGRLGWLSLGLPVEAGGHGRLAEVAVLAQELGRARLPTPLHNGVVQASWAIVGAGAAAARSDLLRAMTDATSRVALCLAGPSGHWTSGALGVTCAQLDGGALRLDGVKRYVPYADSAEVLLVAADGPADGVSLVVIPVGSEGLSVHPAPSIAGDRQAEIRFSHVRADQGDLVGRAGEEGIRRAVLVGTVMLCAEALGASAALIECTVERAGSRTQFGGPIGALQAVQHRCADMAMDHLAAVGALEEALRCLDLSEPAGSESEIAAAAAKTLCGTACLRVAASAHQIWGGTGYLADAGLHHWTRLIKGIGAQLGGAREQRRALAHLLRERGAWSTHEAVRPG